jgi:YHS domain-containing protein
MNHRILKFIPIIPLLLLLACSAEKKQELETKGKSQTESTVADTSQATCPGCGMVMSKSEMIKYNQDEQTLYFCSEHCQKNYLAAMRKDSVISPPAQQ